MKRVLILLFIMLALCDFGCSKNREAAEIPGKRVPLADPFILLYDDVYYAYGTSSSDGIVVYTSDDLTVW
jgi:hypothetical protein